MKKSIEILIIYVVILITMIIISLDTETTIDNCYDTLNNKIVGLRCEVVTIENEALFLILALIELLLLPILLILALDGK